MPDTLPHSPWLLPALRGRCLAAPLGALLSFAILAAGALVSWEVALAQPMPPRGVNEGAGEARAFRPSVMPNPFQLGTADAAGNVTLFPGSPGQVDLSASSLFPGASSVTPSDLAAQFSNPGALEALGIANRSTLSGQASQTGEAYRTLIDSRLIAPPDLRNDPIFGTTRQVVGDINAIAANFADCNVTQTFMRGALPGARIPDLRTCERAIDVSGRIVIDHSYTADVISPISGTTQMSSCGANCVDVWVGRIGNDYYFAGRGCRVFDEVVQFNVSNPAAIASAVIEHVVVDDHLQVLIDGQQVFLTPWGWPIFGGCERRQSGNFPVSVDVTGQIAQPGTREFRIQTLVGGGGEGFVRLRIRFDPTRAVTSDVWTPSSEVWRLASLVNDGFCQASAVSCDDMPPLNGSGCTMVGDVEVCPWMLPSPESAAMASFVNPLCRRVSVDVSCNFFRGAIPCFTDAQGVQRCFDNAGAPADGCTQLRTDSRCGYVSTRCVEGAASPSGTCYVLEDTYDCGVSVNVPTINSATAMTCTGPIRCMGSDCVDLNFETNSNFAQAAAMLQALSMIASDGECDPAGGTCQVFRGNARTCKRAVGGLVNCCNQPGGVSLGDYLRLIMAVRSVDGAVMSLDNANVLRGAWETLRSPVVDAFGAAQELWSSALNSVTGSTAAAASEPAAQGILATAKQAMMRATVEWTAQLFGPQATNMLFSAVVGSGPTAVVGPAVDVATGAVNAGTLQLGGGAALVGSVLSWAMAAYAIYQVFTVLVQIIWACERDEFDLAVKRELRSCHLVGSFCNTNVAGLCIERRESHCCFSSPLSRILQQQLRPQLGRGWGTPRNPDCAGITIADMGAVDWTRVDLSEWVAILASEGMLPDPLALTSDRLTSVGRTALDAADPAAARPNLQDRTIERLRPLDVQGLQTQGRGQARSLQGLPN
jgi:conjugal transfer mating pair stabilization protein TraN